MNFFFLDYGILAIVLLIVALKVFRNPDDENRSDDARRRF